LSGARDGEALRETVVAERIDSSFCGSTSINVSGAVAANHLTLDSRQLCHFDLVRFRLELSR